MEFLKAFDEIGNFYFEKQDHRTQTEKELKSLISL